MPGDAIEVRESIEAKGDVDEDVEMEDAEDATRPNDGDDAADADADADDDVDADGEPDDDADVAQEYDNSARDLLQLIRETSEYLCRFTIKVDGEYVLGPPLDVCSPCATMLIGCSQGPRDRVGIPASCKQTQPPGLF